MAWSYSGDPSNSDLDQVRFIIGDTNESDQLLSNQEINYLINSYGATPAAYHAAQNIVAKFSRCVDESVGAVKITYSQMVKHYTDLALRLKSDASLVALPYVGGISIQNKEDAEQDTDRVKPRFTKNMLKNDWNSRDS